MNKAHNLQNLQSPQTQIQPQIGDYVRSFDFPERASGRQLSGERACYIEGLITKIVNSQGCDFYEIEVQKRVWSGEEVQISHEEFKVYPPVNGLRQLFLMNSLML